MPEQVTVDVDPAPFGRGEDVRFSVNDPDSRLPASDVKVHLVHRVKGQTGSGDDRRLAEKSLYEHVLELGPRTAGESLAGTFRLPEADLPVFESPQSCARWYLKLLAGGREAWFPLPVKPTNSSEAAASGASPTPA